MVSLKKMFLLLFLSHKFVHTCEIVKLLPLGGYEQGFVIFSGQILFRKHDDSLRASSPFGGAEKSCYSMLLAAMFPGGLT